MPTKKTTLGDLCKMVSNVADDVQGNVSEQLFRAAQYGDDVDFYRDGHKTLMSIRFYPGDGREFVNLEMVDPYLIEKRMKVIKSLDADGWPYKIEGYDVNVMFYYYVPESDLIPRLKDVVSGTVRVMPGYLK